MSCFLRRKLVQLIWQISINWWVFLLSIFIIQRGQKRLTPLGWFTAWWRQSICSRATKRADLYEYLHDRSTEGAYHDSYIYLANGGGCSKITNSFLLMTYSFWSDNLDILEPLLSFILFQWVFQMSGQLTCNTILRINRNDINGFLDGRHNQTFTTCQIMKSKRQRDTTLSELLGV